MAVRAGLEFQLPHRLLIRDLNPECGEDATEGHVTGWGSILTFVDQYEAQIVPRGVLLVNIPEGWGQVKPAQK